MRLEVRSAFGSICGPWSAAKGFGPGGLLTPCPTRCSPALSALIQLLKPHPGQSGDLYWCRAEKSLRRPWSKWGGNSSGILISPLTGNSSCLAAVVRGKLMPDPIPKHMSTSARQLVNVIGWDATRILHEEFGGRERLYVPCKGPDTHPISRAIGPDAFAKLREEFGGHCISLSKTATPSNKKAGIIDDILAGGKSKLELAVTHGVTDRYVRMVRREVRELGFGQEAVQHTGRQLPRRNTT